MRAKGTILTVNEAALVLGLSTQSVRSYLRAGKLHGVSGPGPLRMYLSCVLALRAANPTKPGRPPSRARLAELLQEAFA